MTHFTFLQSEWPAVYEAARQAERLVFGDPRAACFYARRAVELAVRWAFEHDPSLKLPYQDHLSALLFEPTFKAASGEAVWGKAQLITRLGNQAVHSTREVTRDNALVAVGELFHVGYWLARTYARGTRPAPELRFDPEALPRGAPVPRQSVAELRTLQAELAAKDERLSHLLADRDALSKELSSLRAQVAAARQRSAVLPDPHDYNEAQTRDAVIDLLLREAGWPLEDERDREFPIEGLATPSGRGRVDYVLWGENGKPLAVVEAKRSRRDPREGQQQAKLYADALEARYGQRPLIFATNGDTHWLWDDLNHPPRRVQGFYDKPALELAIQRRATRRLLAEAEINPAIVERYYQTRAIRRVCESFERHRARKALLVMATGAGKTRTAVALVDVLMRCNWVKRVLFLADRRELVKQAVQAFKQHLPESAPVNLLTNRDEQGRVYAATYPTMMGLVDELDGGTRRFGVGHFDLVIVDEAHRSVFRQYRALFESFDSLLVGLTATPKEDVDRNTYDLFELEAGVPTDHYPLDQAVADGFLVPPVAVSVPLQFAREGIRYDQLSEEEREQWDNLDWDEEGVIPDRVEAEAVNRWLFNQDTVDKVLEHLMRRGSKVAGGDRLGKTILFAKNRAHARFIVERFDANYPHWKGHFAAAVTANIEHADSLIDAFKQPEKPPHLAVSVDMLDTGIDVPEVVNLVFFKLVRSKTKFWQMLGRGTRKRDDLFGPGEHKRFFYLFDYCQNLEYFRENPATSEGAAGEPLSARLFKARLEVLYELDQRLAGEGTTLAEEPVIYVEPETDHELRHAVRGELCSEVAAMNPANFLVRRERRRVETYSRPEAWLGFSLGKVVEAGALAGLPAALAAEPEEVKRFDLLLLRLQLALLRGEAAFNRGAQQVREIAARLREKTAIPLVREQILLLENLNLDGWWAAVTAPRLEAVRRKLRRLVPFVERRGRAPLFTRFEDVMGEEEVVELPEVARAVSFERFRAKVRTFLLAHQDHLTLQKLRTAKPLTASDLTELERLVAASGAGSQDEIERARAGAQGLGLFVRSLVGLDREAAKAAFATFLEGRTTSANQIEFINLIVDHLTEHGVMAPGRLYESPFTDLAPHGPEHLSQPADVAHLLRTLEDVRATALAA